MLAHSSGEWIASDWPVCAVSRDRNAAAHGRGADLCPPLCAVHAGRHCRRGRSRCAGSCNADRQPKLEPEKPKATRQRAAERQPLRSSQRTRRSHATAAPHSTPVAASARSRGIGALRDRLLAELERSRQRRGCGPLGASLSCPTRTRLTAADAQRVEEGFLGEVWRASARTVDGSAAAANENRSRRCAVRSGCQRTKRRADGRRRSTRARWRCRSRAGFGTATTSDTWPATLSRSAAGSRRTPIICASRKAGRSAARSAMSSPSRCVAAIIARSIATAMKPHGGERLGSIRRSRPARCGSKRIRWRRFGQNGRGRRPLSRRHR